MPVEAPLPKGHPLLEAWEAYQLSDEYANSFRWAAEKEHRAGSMWAAFMNGWNARGDTLVSPYPAGITLADHIAHDMRVGRFPERSDVLTFLAEAKDTTPPD